MTFAGDVPTAKPARRTPEVRPDVARRADPAGRSPPPPDGRGLPGARHAVATVERIAALTPVAGPDGGLTPLRIWKLYGLGALSTTHSVLHHLVRAGRIVADGPDRARRYRRPPAPTGDAP